MKSEREIQEEIERIRWHRIARLGRRELGGPLHDDEAAYVVALLWVIGEQKCDLTPSIVMLEKATT